MKTVQIRSFFWSVFSCIRIKYRKIRTRKNSVFGHFLRREFEKKVDKLDVDKLVPLPVDLSKLSDVAKNDIVKEDVYMMKNIEEKIPDVTNLATNTTLNAKINEVKKEVPSITNLTTTTALNAIINEVKNKYLILLA